MLFKRPAQQWDNYKKCLRKNNNKNENENEENKTIFCAISLNRNKAAAWKYKKKLSQTKTVEYIEKQKNKDTHVPIARIYQIHIIFVIIVSTTVVVVIIAKHTQNRIEFWYKKVKNTQLEKDLHKQLQSHFGINVPMNVHLHLDPIIKLKST